MHDAIFVLQWWLLFFLLGITFLPLTSKVFSAFFDNGYLFSKVLGIALTSYSVFLLSSLKILEFGYTSLILVLIFLLILNLLLLKHETRTILKSKKIIFLVEEIIFLVGIALWTYIRGHEPSIHGLEKFMDFGFMNSILRSQFLPAPDIWFTPFKINYYYFGHFVAALLTKLSFLPSNITYNLMISTIFSFTFSLSASLGVNFFTKKGFKKASVLGGLLAGFLVAFSGNLHTIYSFFSPYNTDNPVPFWSLAFKPDLFPNSYWYPNATRFIPLTIHEFPLYSFIVSDLHGHVSDIPFVLLTIAIVMVFFLGEKITKLNLFLCALLLSIMYMTNAWDALIYFLLISSAILFIKKDRLEVIYAKRPSSFLFIKNNVRGVRNIKKYLKESLGPILLIFVLFILFSLPFSINFKPFVSGIGVLCAPEFLTKIGKLGPFIFEAEHCQKTFFWQLSILYGFFYFFVISFLLYLILKREERKALDFFVLFLILISTLLIIVPEFFYVKDIYPTHYRANTMFKLVYQSFIMLSLSSSYIIVRILKGSRNIVFYGVSCILLALVFTYPYFAIKSYYSDLKKYQGISGTEYLKAQLPEDYEAIKWINKNIKKQPVILEAQGDSYTDYGRISANTGLPTVLGWTVHEWLWRGTYDIPAPRIEEVKKIYETENLEETKSFINKYNISYIYIGNLEREKYPNLNEEKFQKLGKIVFKKNQTKIYLLSGN